MFRNRLYYAAKPWLPYRLRLATRRIFARIRRSQSQNIWPIQDSAGCRPENWPGWPDGKQFGFVLVHDVESQTGLDRVRQLAELEMRLGFRSAFYFIPEGSYPVPADLRCWLTDNGFEVGVHDLRHDGKLFRNRDSFKQDAAKINGYLKDWGAVGFRTAFMFHNLDWVHDLDISYDGSTFDTDPFEPQPDGVGTIFPFWVPAPGTDHRSTLTSQPSPRRCGYVEMPYTLPQDSTLFNLFGERTIEIWKNKLEWIADRGGMALLDVHPDYLAFDGRSNPGAREYPVSHYENFLGLLKQSYEGMFWHALPKAVAAFCRDAAVEGVLAGNASFLAAK